MPHDGAAVNRLGSPSIRHVVAPNSVRRELALGNVQTGVPCARACWHRRSTLPPGVAWGTRREVARLATRVLRAVAIWWVGRWMLSAKQES